MGNEQSQESAAQPEPEPEEHFDLSEIPDDREVSPDLNTSMAKPIQPISSPTENTPLSKKRKRKKQRKSSTSTGKLSPGEVLPDEVKALRQKPAPDTRPLREREPETYHIYATSDDSNDEESTVVARTSPPKASATGNDAKGEEISAEETAQSADLAHAALSSGQPPKEVQHDVTNSAVSADTKGTIPEPRVTTEGRFCCPFAQDYACDHTFAKRAAAIRHGGIHTSTFTCSVCGKHLSRQDTLTAHLRKHTALEIASAEAGNKDVEKNDRIETDSRDEDDNGEDATSGPFLKDLPREGDPTELATPPETAHAGSATQLNGLKKHSQPSAEDSDKAEKAQESGTPHAPSDRHSPSPPSVFDDATETIVKETPIPRGGLRRKRNAVSAFEASRQNGKLSTKRAERLSNSPPTSIQSRESEISDLIEDVSGLLNRQNTEKIVPRLQKSRQGSIEGWAQKYTPGSQLRHPVFNPKSPAAGTVHRIDVEIPRTSQGGPSSTNSNESPPSESEHAVADNEHDTDQLKTARPRKTKARTAPYTTPKGKKRAASGVDYSTPAGNHANPINDASDGHESEPTNIATSVAVKSFAAVNNKKRSREQEEQSTSKSTEQDAKESGASRPNKRVRVNGTAEKDAAECPRCHRTFANEFLLRRHMNKASAHYNLLSCQGCSEHFATATLLASHQKETGHGTGNGQQGHTGAFSESEVTKLNNWRDLFCEDYNITHEQFNDMMTDTLQRQSKERWNWPFIGKAEFLKDYCNVLPRRNKRSMLRYRERNFQNLEGSRNWTPDDDRDLVRLHKELGPKWSEIARRLSRTVDAVSQRWRHKLQLGNTEQGEWTLDEKSRFRSILEQVRRESGTTAELDEWRIPWNKVSEKMGTRTAQQCSNHWRALHSVKRGGRWVKVEGLEKTPGSSRILTPSKMERRLKGEAVIPSGRKVLSEEFVHEDEEGDEDGEGEGEGAEAENEDEEAADHGAFSEDDQKPGQGDSEDEEGGSALQDDQTSSMATEEAEGPPTKTPHRPARGARNPVAEKTPGKTLGSSQLFAQTQVNTSALKASQRDRGRVVEVEDRPSPNIPIQRRVLSSRSPLQEIKVKENGDLELNRGDEDSDGEDDSDDADADADATVPVADVEDEHETSSSANSEDEEEEEEAESLGVIGRLKEDTISTGSETDGSEQEQEQQLAEADQSKLPSSLDSSEDSEEEGEEEEDDDDNDDDDDGDGGDEDEDEDEDDDDDNESESESSVGSTTSTADKSKRPKAGLDDFMNSINESVQRAKSSWRRRSRSGSR